MNTILTQQKASMVICKNYKNITMFLARCIINHKIKILSLKVSVYGRFEVSEIQGLSIVEN